jgi:hypothetical protein
VVLTSTDARAWTRIETDTFRGRAVDGFIEAPLGTFARGYNAPPASDNTSGFVLWPIRGDGSFGKMRVVETDDQPRLVTGAMWTGAEFLAWGPRYGAMGDGPTTVLASPDARTWTVRAEIRAGKRAVVMQIVAADDRLVAVGYEGRSFPLTPRAWTSRDAGRTWNLADVPTVDARIDSVAVQGPLLVARGMQSWGPNQLALTWTSTNGRTWAQLPGGQDLPAVPGFGGLAPVSIGDRTCVAGSFHDAQPPWAAIYCRAAT